MSVLTRRLMLAGVLVTVGWMATASPMAQPAGGQAGAAGANEPGLTVTTTSPSASTVSVTRAR